MSRRRRRGRPITGVLVLDKPAGLTSNAALQRVKQLYFAAKAGHTGSLDPMATGVLPLCFGEATRFSQILLDADKRYRCTVLLGQRTTTGDAEGEVLEQIDASGLNAEVVARALEGFRGPIEQVPPMYSAIKKDGQPLYELARQGLEVEREARSVVIHELELEDFRPGQTAELDLRVHCSKGTYVRTLAEDLGATLGCGGHVVALRRTGAGPFDEGDCVSLDQLEALHGQRDFAVMAELLLPVEAMLEELPEVRVVESSGHYLRQGQPVLVPRAPTSGRVCLKLESGELLGMGEILDDGRVAPRRLIGP